MRVSKKQLRLEMKLQLQQEQVMRRACRSVLRLMLLSQRHQAEFGHADSQRQFIYRVEVHTGTAFGAGTDANVFCTLGGEHELSSGEVHLAKSLHHVNKFERGQVGCGLLHA